MHIGKAGKFLPLTHFDAAGPFFVPSAANGAFRDCIVRRKRTGRKDRKY
jgi:hypothetical protein